jgi:hypothetical protein
MRGVTWIATETKSSSRSRKTRTSSKSVPLASDCYGPPATGASSWARKVFSLLGVLTMKKEQMAQFLGDMNDQLIARSNTGLLPGTARTRGTEKPCRASWIGSAKKTGGHYRAAPERKL